MFSVMNKLEKFNKNQETKKFPRLEPGQTVRVHQKIKEGDKERIQVFEGLIISKKHGKSINGTITVRKTSFGIGVERIFPIHSPNIEKIEIIKRGKVRRAKLYYIREKTAKEARLKELPLKPEHSQPESESEKETEKEKPENEKETQEETKEEQPKKPQEEDKSEEKTETEKENKTEEKQEEQKEDKSEEVKNPGSEKTEQEQQEQEK